MLTRLTHKLHVQACKQQGQQIILQVADMCNSCDATTLNLPAATFQQYLTQPTSHLSISYQQVLRLCSLPISAVSAVLQAASCSVPDHIIRVGTHAT